MQIILEEKDKEILEDIQNYSYLQLAEKYNVTTSYVHILARAKYYSNKS